MPYKFESAASGPNNFVNMYIDYAKDKTDAAHEFHEANALFLLSVASQGMKIEMPNVPNGLRANLYLIQYGTSSHSRKSTAMEIAVDILQRSIPGVQLPANFTPGGLEEELAEHSRRPAALYVDEFSRVVETMATQTYMAGLKQFLLTMYGHEKWEYRRTSKGKAGKKSRDEVIIDGSHLCLLGNVTPTISKYIKPRDIEDGFLARFGIIAPETKPRKRKVIDLHHDEKKRSGLVLRLSKIRKRCESLADEKYGVMLEDGTPISGNAYKEIVRMDYDAMDAVDNFQDEIEEYKGMDIELIMSERMGMMAYKLSLLFALAECDPDKMEYLHIKYDHACAGVITARRWLEWGRKFAMSLYESDMDKHIRRALAWLVDHDGTCARWQMAKHMRLTKRAMDEVQLTMMDRGLIHVYEERVEGSKKPTLMWRLSEGGDDE